MPLRVPPALSSSQCYRRAVVRACAEQLRVIEGRLDVGCGPRFEEQLSQDDLNGVARAILTLQRRTELCSETAWLDELARLSSAEVDERCVELVRRIKERLDELARAVVPAVEPTTLLGLAVVRRGTESEPCRGKVLEYNAATGFRLQYTDGDAEDVALRELTSMLVRDDGSSMLELKDGESKLVRDGDGGSGDGGGGGGAGSGAVADLMAGPLAGLAQSHDGGAAAAGGMCVKRVYERLARHRREQEEAAAVAEAAMAAKQEAEAEAREERERAAAANAAAAAAGAAPVSVPAPPPKSGKKRGRPPKAGTSPVPPPAESAAAAAAPPAESAAEEAAGGAGGTGGLPPAAFAGVAAVAAADDASEWIGDGPLRADELPPEEPPPPPPPPPKPRLPTYSGLTIQEVEETTVAAREAAGKRRKSVPRELRGLAMPDREWNVSMPFHTTAAGGYTTRGGFASDDAAAAQAAAEAARELHQRRVREKEEAEAAAEGGGAARSANGGADADGGGDDGAGPPAEQRPNLEPSDADAEADAEAQAAPVS